MDASHQFYCDPLGLTFEGGDGDYAFTERIAGAKHFGVWPLPQAAMACFGSPEWPADMPIPRASIEFGVRDVAEAAAELQHAQHQLIHEAKTEP